MPRERVEPSERYSPEKTSLIRKQAIQDAINSQKNLFLKSKDRIDISDINALTARATEYINACTSAGIVPNLEGLACCCGFSRAWLYQYLKDHPTDESAIFLDRLRLGWASLRMSLSETKVLDPASTIFVLKNSGLNFTDKQEYEVAQAPECNDPFRPRWAWNLSESEYHKKVMEDIEEIVLLAGDDE